MTIPGTATRTFFSFIQVAEGRHGDYNEWHQLDHRPENLALPGVIHGDRWVRTPHWRSASSVAEASLADVHYLAMYWFAEPARASVREWAELGESTLQEGRRQDLRCATRLLQGSFVPIKGYVHPRIRISVSALPFRPHRGVHVSLTEVTEPDSAEANELFRWYDQERVPQLVDHPSVAGVWTFKSRSVTGSGPDGARVPWPSSQLRLTLTYFDGEVVDIGNDLGPGESSMFVSSFETIRPWEWDWFADDRQDG